MEYGFIKVRAHSPELRVADVAYNAERILCALKEADGAGVQLLVTPKLSLCGATCGDLFAQKTLLNGCLEGLKTVVEGSKGYEPLLFVGLPFAFEGSLYDCVATIKGGKLLAIMPQESTASVFVKAQGTGTVSLFGEDVPFSPDVVLCDKNNSNFTVGLSAKANLVVQPAATQELVGVADERRLLARAYSLQNACGYLVCEANEGESSSEGAYAGHHLIVENGKILSESLPFAGGVADGEIDVEKIALIRQKQGTAKEGSRVCVPFRSRVTACKLLRKIEKNPFLPEGEWGEERAELILNIQAHALARRLSHTHSKTAVIGVSGGLDSALAFLVTVRAFDLLKKDRKDIIAYTMPGFGTTARTKNNSLALMQTMGATAKTVDITPAVKQHFFDIEHDENILDVTYENAQARMRTMILMDVANKAGGLVIGTGDMSELALGWCTYNGDHMSHYAVNCNVPKTLVKALVSYEGTRLGGEAEGVIKSIVETEISPELLPPDKAGNIAQKTEDLVGPYELHDFYLYYCVKYGFTPKKIYFLATCVLGEKYSKEELVKWLKNFYRRFFTQQFKRSCSPDGVRVGKVSLARGDFQMPSDALSALWLQEIDEIK